MKKVNCMYTLFFILIASTITAGLVYGAGIGNPFLDFINKNKTQPAKENPFLQQPTNAITTPILNASPVKVVPEPGTVKKRCTVTIDNFVYMLIASSDKQVKARYEQSSKSLCFSDWLKIDAKETVKILPVYQQLQFSGLRFECNCGCVKPFEYNHHEVTAHFKIKTSLSLRVDKTSVKCKCGCVQL